MTIAAADAPTMRPLTDPGSGFGWALRDTVAMIGRNLTTMRRLP
ncbi:MAG: hypothetical protein JWN99_2178, partial [Ilumatobacteraceae bacterium]|nr:hypothetical protein [Ilumatobacteraceae bacterium]